MPPELPVDALASFAADLVGRDPRRYTNGEDFFLNCCVYPEIFSPEMAELWMKQISEKLPKDADLRCSRESTSIRTVCAARIERL